MNQDTVTKAAKAFRNEKRHWEMLPVRLRGQLIVGRRFDTVPAPGKVRLPSQTTYHDSACQSTEERDEMVFRACIQAALDAVAPAAETEAAA